MIKIGEKLPETTFTIKTEIGIESISTAELCKKGKIVIVGVPGAFTPTCHQKHLPPFIEMADEFKKHGINCLTVTSVNDVHVMSNWQQQIDNKRQMLFLADGNGEFAKAIRLDIDLSAANMGIRSKRYAMLVENGVVKQLNIEESPGEAEISSAKNMLNCSK